MPPRSVEPEVHGWVSVDTRNYFANWRLSYLDFRDGCSIAFAAGAKWSYIGIAAETNMTRTTSEELHVTGTARNFTLATRGRNERLPAAKSEYVTFNIGAEEFAVDILSVQEIRSYEPPVPIPKTAPHLLGVFHLRGLVMPMVNLRHCLGYPSAQFSDVTALIVLNVYQRLIGIVVDSVSSVLTIDGKDIQPAPQMGSIEATRHILGIAKVTSEGESKTLLIADIAHLLSEYELIKNLEP